jgi:hypothetical protein
MWHEWARGANRIFVGKREEKRLLGKYEGRIILTWILRCVISVVLGK